MSVSYAQMALRGKVRTAETKLTDDPPIRDNSIPRNSLDHHRSSIDPKYYGDTNSGTERDGSLCRITKDYLSREMGLHQRYKRNRSEMMNHECKSRVQEKCQIIVGPEQVRK